MTTSCSLLFQRLQILLNKLNILYSKFVIYNLEITDGVNIPFDMDNLRIVETADNLEDGIDSTDMRKEGVTKPSTSRGSTGQASNIVNCKIGRDFRDRL